MKLRRPKPAKFIVEGLNGRRHTPVKVYPGDTYLISSPMGTSYVQIYSDGDAWIVQQMQLSFDISINVLKQWMAKIDQTEE